MSGKKKEKKKANHLLCGHTNGLDAELAAAEVEEVFQVRTQEVDDENVMETLLSKMVDLRNTDCVASRGRGMREHFAGCEKKAESHTGAVQGSVRSIFIPQLRSFRLPRFL
jgi:hypothetical protein